MTVGRCIAVSWEMLGAGNDVSFCHAGYITGAQFSCQKRIIGKRTNPNNRILWLTVDIRIRRKVCIDSHCGKFTGKN